MRIIGLMTGILLLALGFLWGGRPGNMFDLPSLVIVFLVPISFTLMGHGNDLWRALMVAFLHRPVETQTCLRYIKVLDTLRHTLFWTGFVAALIGAISMSSAMDSWEHFGPAFAVLLLTPFYGIVMAELIIAPMINRLEAEYL